MADVEYAGKWELPVLGPVAAPGAVLIRPDGHVAWAGDAPYDGLADALTTWFGPPTAGPGMDRTGGRVQLGYG